MAYRKFIKRNGKVFGPYYYESYRDGSGKIRKRYMGTVDPDIDKKRVAPTMKEWRNVFSVFILVLFLAGGAVIFSQTDLVENVVDRITGLIIESPLEDDSEVVEVVKDDSSDEEVEVETDEPPISDVSDDSEVVEELEEVDESIELQSLEDDSVVEVFGDNEAAEEVVDEDNETDGRIEVPEVANETSVLNITNETLMFPIENESIESNETEAQVNITNKTTEIISPITNDSVDSNETIEVPEIMNETLFNITNETLVNETEIFNETILLNVSTLQYKAVIGRPVKWIKQVALREDEGGRLQVAGGDLLIELPKEAENISILTNGEVKEALDLIERYEDLVNETDKEEIVSGFLTGNVVLDVGDAENVFEKFWSWMRGFTITGNVVVFDESGVSSSGLGVVKELEDSKVVDLENVLNATGAKELAIEYLTPAPEAFEENIFGGKRVSVSGPELNYTDILAYVELDNSVGVNDSRLRIYWMNEGIEINFSSFDLDGDGFVDYVEWIVPHLSEQIYEIIYITKAEHLDENRSFVEDVYDSVKELDGVWSPVIGEGEYVRVTFERNLTSDRDITIYPRVVSGVPRVEVYEVNGTEVIAEFVDIVEGKNKVFLTSLVGAQDVFDLRVVGGSLEFDYIVDPVFGLDIGTWTDTAGTFDATPTRDAWTGFPFNNQVSATGEYAQNVNDIDIDLVNGGHYLVLYNLFITSDYNGRLGFESKLTLDGVDVKGSFGSCYQRNNNNDDAVCEGGAIIDAAAGDDVRVEWNYRTDNGDQVAAPLPGRSSLQILKLNDDADYLRLGKTANEQQLTQQTWDSFNWESEFEKDASYTHVANSDTVTLDAGHYLVVAGSAWTSASSGRSGMVHRVSLDGTPSPYGRSFAFTRGSDDNVEANPWSISLFEVGASTTFVLEYSDMQIGTTYTSDTNEVNMGLQMVKLPDSVNFYRAYADTSRNIAASATPAKLDMIDSEDEEDAAYNGDAATGDISINSGYEGDYLFTFSGTGTRNPASGSTRNMPYMEWYKDGSTLGLGGTGWYARGDQGNYDVYEGGGSVGVIVQGSGTSTFSIYQSSTGDTITNNYLDANEYGVTAIRLDDLLDDPADYPPSVDLLSPGDNYVNITSAAIDLNFNVSVSGYSDLDNCSLWHNATGNWHLNVTNVVSGLSNSTQFTLYDLLNVDFIWNVECTNNLGISGFNSTNRSASVVYYTIPITPTPITNSTDGSNLTSQDLNCFDLIVDPDGDNMNVTVDWYKNGGLNLSIDYNDNYANGTNFNAVLLSGNTSVGEGWKCGIVLDDGTTGSNQGNSSELIVLNAVPDDPSPGINSSDGTNLTNQDLNCFAAISDLDGDSLDVTVRWFRDDSLVVTSVYNGEASGSSFNAVLLSGNTSVGDSWKCEMTLSDGVASSSSVNSSSLSIENVVPSTPVSSINSSDGTNLTGVDLNCFATITDPDWNDLNVTVNWYKNDVLNLTVDYNNGYPSGASFNAVLLFGNTTVGEFWKCGLVLDDGRDVSVEGNSSSLSILNSPPYWSNNQTNIVTVYSPTILSYFNVTWQDDWVFSSAWFESNFSGASQNYSMNNIEGNIYSYQTILPAGSYYWRSIANDSLNYWNESDQWSFVVVKAEVVFDLDSAPGWVVAEGEQSNVSCSADTSEVNVSLYRNDAGYIGSSVGGVVWDNQTLSAGQYNYTCNTTGGQNYSSGSESSILDISIKIISNCSLSFVPDSPIVYGTEFNVSCSCDNPEASEELWRDGVNVTSEIYQNVSLAAASYDYVCNVSGTAGYSLASEDFVYTVDKADHVVHLALEDFESDASVVYPSLTNATGWLEVAQGVAYANLTRNGTVVDSGSSASEMITLAAGYYDYTYFYPASENYTEQVVTWFLRVNRSGSVVNLTLGGVDGDVTFEAGDFVNVSADLIVPSLGSIELYENGTLINSGVSHLSNYSQYVVPGDYNMSVVYPESENYSAALEWHVLTIEDSVNPVIDFVLPSSEAGNYSQDWIVANVTASDYNLDSVVVYLYNSSGLVGFSESLFVNFSSLVDGVYYLNATANDSSGNLNWTETRVVVLDGTSPGVVLGVPEDGYVDDVSEYVDLIFNASVSDDGGLVNCSLWHNATGVWHLNESEDVTGVSNVTEFGLVNLTNVSFVWNVGCFDRFGNFGFGVSNRSVVLNWTYVAPAVPTVPTQIECEGDGNCNISISESVVLNASGSVDVNGDNVTYFLEASLENVSVVGNSTDVSNVGSVGGAGDSVTGQWRDAAGTFDCTPAVDVWTGFSFNTEDSADGVYVQNVNDVDVDIGETGHYLVLYGLHFTSDYNGRIGHEGRLTLDGTPVYGSYSSGYLRDPANDDEFLSGGAIISATAGQDVRVEIVYRTSRGDQVVTPVAGDSYLQIIQLDDSWDYFRAHETAGTSMTEASWNQISWEAEDEKDVGSFTHVANSDAIELENTGHYLIVAGYGISQATSRGSFLTRATLNGNPIETSYGYEFIRDSSAHEEGNPMSFTLIEASANDLLRIEARHDFETSTTAMTTLTSHTGVMVVALPDGDYYRGYGNDAIDPSVGASYALLDMVDVEDEEDAGSFDGDALGTINIEDTSDYLIFFSGEGTRASTANTERDTTQVKLFVTGTESPFGGGWYDRGDQSTTGTFEGGTSFGAYYSLADTDYIDFRGRQTGDVGDGQFSAGQYGVTVLNFAGLFSGGASSETNTTETVYENLGDNYSKLTKIDVTVEVDSYNPLASVEQVTSDPDLWLEVYNGTGWTNVGNFNLPANYTGTGLDTTNYNFSLSITDSSILTAWQNLSNQDIRVKGVSFDYYNSTIYDEINYTNVLVSIVYKNWTEIGNHSETDFLEWDVSSLGAQTCVDFRARAIDLDGNNTYSDYFTKNSCLNISVFDVLLNYPFDDYVNDSYRYVDLAFNASVSSSDGLANCSLWHNASGVWHLNQSEDVGGFLNVTEFGLVGLTDVSFVWNVECFDVLGGSMFAADNRSVVLNWTNGAVFINVHSPVNIVYSDSVIWFNATSNKTIDTWIVNYNGTNVTISVNSSLEVEDGSHNLLFYGNDSFGNWGLNDSVSFSVDTTAPVIIEVRINESSSILRDSVVRVNASIVDDNLDVGSVRLEVIPPISLAYNVSPSRSGDEFYDDFVLNEIGQWRFRFYAGDDAGHDAVSDFAEDGNSNNYIDVYALGSLNVVLISPVGGPNSQPQNLTFELMANVSCVGAVGEICGEVNGSVRYNMSSLNPDSSLRGGGVYDVPFYVVESNPQSCGAMSVGGAACNLTWTVNTTGNLGEVYSLDVNFSSSEDVAVNDTDDTMIRIVSPFISITLSNALANVEFGSSLFPDSVDNPAVNNSEDLYNITCYHVGSVCNVSMKGNSNLVSGINSIGVGNITWNKFNDNATASEMSFGYNVINSSLPDLMSQLIYFWMDIPPTQIAGDYQSNFTIMGKLG